MRSMPSWDWDTTSFTSSSTKSMWWASTKVWKVSVSTGPVVRAR